MDDATAETWRAERRSKVGVDIEDVGHGVVKLTLVHDGFEAGQRDAPGDLARDGPPSCRV